MADDYSPPKTRILPPVVLLFSIFLSVALDRWLPIVDLWGNSARNIGYSTIVVSLAVNVYCALQFRRRKTTIIPFQESTELLTGGLYQYSRNPIYLCMVVLLVGLAMALGSLSPWVVPPLFLGVIGHRFIRHEEAMLTTTFGQAYHVYCQRVRRWL